MTRTTAAPSQLPAFNQLDPTHGETPVAVDIHQMAGAFQLLRSNDLVWSRVVGERSAVRRRHRD